MIPGEPESSASLAEVSAKDSEVLRVIEQEELTSFSFEGLKRRIGTHPETLSRVLDRLEEEDIVEKTESSYRVTEKGKEWLKVHPLSVIGDRLTLVRTMLPPMVRPSQIFHELKGRWFGQLRWLGYSETPSDIVLKWVTADGKVQLDARLGEGELVIEGRILDGKDVASAVRASHQLMSHISETYMGPRSGRALMFDASPASRIPN